MSRQATWTGAWESASYVLGQACAKTVLIVLTSMLNMRGLGPICPIRIEARQKYQKEQWDRISEYKKRWAEDNGKRVAASKREYYERNRAEVISRSREWAEKNPDKVKSAKANNRRKRRAAKYASRGTFTAREFKELCEKYGNRSLCCGDTEAVLEADHVVPLTRGGLDDISNIQPLCGYCNRRKFVEILDYRPRDEIPLCPRSA
jgi:5-methylcytosine-specific restriction endonuclease McrA